MLWESWIVLRKPGNKLFEYRVSRHLTKRGALNYAHYIANRVGSLWRWAALEEDSVLEVQARKRGKIHDGRRIN